MNQNCLSLLSKKYEKIREACNFHMHFRLFGFLFFPAQDIVDQKKMDKNESIRNNEISCLPLKPRENRASIEK